MNTPQVERPHSTIVTAFNHDPWSVLKTATPTVKEWLRREKNFPPLDHDLSEAAYRIKHRVRS